MDTACEKCGKPISKRAAAHVWNGQTVVCTKCRNELQAEAGRHAAAIGFAGQPHTPWMVFDGKTQYGPYTTEQVIEMLRRGQVDWLWQIWREGMKKWMKIGSLFSMAEMSNSGRIELRDHGQGDGTYRPSV